LLAFISHSLGLTAQAIILSALRASSLLHSDTDSKTRHTPWLTTRFAFRHWYFPGGASTSSPSSGIECAQGHLDRPFGAQCHRCFRFHCLAGNYFKSPTAQNFSQHNPKLHPGEAFTNAGSWSTAKREESIFRQGALKFRRPTIRIEFGRVRKISVGAVHG